MNIFFIQNHIPLTGLLSVRKYKKPACCHMKVSFRAILETWATPPEHFMFFKWKSKILVCLRLVGVMKTGLAHICNFSQLPLSNSLTYVYCVGWLCRFFFACFVARDPCRSGCRLNYYLTPPPRFFSLPTILSLTQVTVI